jgi:hypothetical protein
LYVQASLFNEIASLNARLDRLSLSGSARLNTPVQIPLPLFKEVSDLNNAPPEDLVGDVVFVLLKMLDPEIIHMAAGVILF